MEMKIADIGRIEVYGQCKDPYYCTSIYFVSKSTENTRNDLALQRISTEYAVSWL